MTLGLGNYYVSYSKSNFDYYSTNSILLDGTDDHITLGGDGDVPANGTIKPVTGGLTMAAWVKYDPETPENAAKGPYGDTSSHNIINVTKGGGYGLSFSNLQFYALVQLRDGDGNLANLQISAGESGGHYNLLTNPTSGTDYNKYLYKENGWHFVVVTWDGNKVIKMYIDGGTSQQGDTSGSGSTNFGSHVQTGASIDDPSGNNPDGDNKWYMLWSTTSTSVTNTWGQDHGALVGSNLAADGSSSGNIFEGNIGDIGIWDVALTNSEIEALYNNHRPVDMSTTQTGNLQGYWRADTGSGTALTEVVGDIGSNGVLVNGPTWSVDTPYNEPNATIGNY